jgi:hypothetical protein
MPEKSNTIQEFLYKKNSTPQTHENRTHEFPPICDFSIVNSFQRKMTVNDFFCHQVFNVMASMATCLHLLFKIGFCSDTRKLVGRMEMRGAASPSAFLFILYIRIGKKVIACLLILPSPILKKRNDR